MKHISKNLKKLLVLFAFTSLCFMQAGAMKSGMKKRYLKKRHFFGKFKPKKNTSTPCYFTNNGNEAERIGLKEETKPSIEPTEGKHTLEEERKKYPYCAEVMENVGILWNNNCMIVSDNFKNGNDGKFYCLLPGCNKCYPSGMPRALGRHIRNVHGIASFLKSLNGLRGTGKSLEDALRELKEKGGGKKKKVGPKKSATSFLNKFLENDLYKCPCSGCIYEHKDHEKFRQHFRKHGQSLISKMQKLVKEQEVSAKGAVDILEERGELVQKKKRRKREEEVDDDDYVPDSDDDDDKSLKRKRPKEKDPRKRRKTEE